MVATMSSLHMKAKESKFPQPLVFPFNNVILISLKIISVFCSGLAQNGESSPNIPVEYFT